MIKRPKAISALIVAFAAVAISLPVQIMIMYGHMPWEFQAIAAKIAPLNWAVMAGCLLHIPLLNRASKALYFTIPSLCLLIHFNNTVVAQYAHNFDATTTMMATLGFLCLTSLFLLPQAQYAVNNPKVRWWLIAKRHQVHMPAMVNLEAATIKGLRSETHDLSAGGAFVHCEGIKEEFQGKDVVINLNLGGRARAFKGRITRVARNARGSYPSGFGVQFTHNNIMDKIALQTALMQRQFSSRVSQAMAA